MGTIQDYIDTRDTSTKHRSFIHTPLRTIDQQYVSAGVPVYLDDYSNSALGWHQQTDSIDHQGFRTIMRRKRHPRNIGGPFISTKLAIGLPSRKTWDLTRYATSGWLSYKVVGDLFPHLEVQRLAKAVHEDNLRTTSVWQENGAMSVADLQVTGEQLMLSLVPTTAAFDAVTALGEPISDGALFGLPGRSLLLHEDPGGEYLNTMFGIVPTLGEIDSFNSAIDSYDRVIKQYMRDANKLIRRRTKPFHLPEEVSTVSYSTNPVTVGGRTVSANLANNSGSTITTRINREVWYAGAFKYFVPEQLSAFERNIFEWQRAYAIAPDPASLWNLLPFTWLADWFSNGGNAIRHLFLQSTDGATQVYGYVMCKSEVRKTYVWRGNLRVDNVLQPATITAEVVKTIKQRVRVSPFGVHFTGVDFTPYQLAILAALGVAK